MNTRRLALHWITGIAGAVLLAWLASPSGSLRMDAVYRALEPAEVTAMRRDSASAATAARAAGIARGDSVAAVVFIRPRSWRDPARERASRAFWLPVTLGGIAIILLRSSALWWRSRRGPAT